MSHYSDILDNIHALKATKQYVGFNPMSQKNTAPDNLKFIYVIMAVIACFCLAVIIYIWLHNSQNVGVSLSSVDLVTKKSSLQNMQQNQSDINQKQAGVEYENFESYESNESNENNENNENNESHAENFNETSNESSSAAINKKSSKSVDSKISLITRDPKNSIDREKNESVFGDVYPKVTSDVINKNIFEKNDINNKDNLDDRIKESKEYSSFETNSDSNFLFRTSNQSKRSELSSAELNSAKLNSTELNSFVQTSAKMDVQQILNMVKDKKFDQALAQSVYLSNMQKMMVQAKVFEQTDPDQAILLYQKLILNENSPIEYVLKLAILNEKVGNINQAYYFYDMFERHNTQVNKKIQIFVENKIHNLKKIRSRQ